MTPEGKIKDKVKKLLKDYDVYFFMPNTHGYGSSGVPDIVGLYKGQFIGIECKAFNKQATDLQMHNLTQIQKNGGIAILMDGSGLGVLKMILDSLSIHGSGKPGAFYHLIGDKVVEE
jgi:hypothetical protein